MTVKVQESLSSVLRGLQFDDPDAKVEADRMLGFAERLLHYELVLAVKGALLGDEEWIHLHKKILQTPDLAHIFALGVTYGHPNADSFDEGNLASLVAGALPLVTVDKLEFIRFFINFFDKKDNAEAPRTLNRGNVVIKTFEISALVDAGRIKEAKSLVTEMVTPLVGLKIPPEAKAEVFRLAGEIDITEGLYDSAHDFLLRAIRHRKAEYGDTEAGIRDVNLLARCALASRSVYTFGGILTSPAVLQITRTGPEDIQKLVSMLQDLQEGKMTDIILPPDLATHDRKVDLNMEALAAKARLSVVFRGIWRHGIHHEVDIEYLKGLSLCESKHEIYRILIRLRALGLITGTVDSDKAVFKAEWIQPQPATSVEMVFIENRLTDLLRDVEILDGALSGKENIVIEAN